MILVTGATGNNGVGITKRLTGRRLRVRAMVRKHPHASDALPDVEYVTADFDDPESVRPALEGVHRAFLTTNSTERVEAQQLNFVKQALAAGYGTSFAFRNYTQQGILQCVSCVITPLWRMRSAHPEWRSRTCVPICTCKASSDVATEMSLTVLAYNLKRVLNLVGTQKLIAALA